MMPQAPRTGAPGIRAPRVYSGAMASEGQKTGEGSGTADPAPPADAYPRLRHIEITNYKALDHLVLDIPAPTMPGDPDIFVVGSKNGLGKTSLLECCALIHLAVTDGETWRDVFGSTPADLFPIRTEGRQARVRADYEPADRHTLTLEREFPFYGLSSRSWKEDGSQLHVHSPSHVKLAGNPADRIYGRASDSFVHPDLLFFHSNRKIVDGPIRIQGMLNPDEEGGSSAIKLKAVRLLMVSSGLVEGNAEGDAERRLEQLNNLLFTFTGGRIDKKLRPVGKDQLDLRIVTPRGTTFSFDGLSSGQKEIVTTLFLIWNETLAHPALVLIDEPELHLNAEWQREFLRHLLALAPKNQYILATHSEDIFASVSEERRVLLEASHG